MLQLATDKGFTYVSIPDQPDGKQNDASANTDPLLHRLGVDHLFSVAYEELRRLAGSVRQSHPGATMNPTALVHEAWLKLAKSPEFSATSRLHFKRIAARAMRQVLIEAARRRYSQKRGGDAGFSWVMLEDEAAQALPTPVKDLLALDDALRELERLNPRQALLVEARFFGGFDMDEAATLLEVSPSTAQREWRVARAWLAQQLVKE